MVKDFIRKDLQNYKPYHAPAVPYEVKLDANESSFSLDGQVKEEILRWMAEEENLNRYPDTDSTELRETLAGFWQVEPENVICGVGSDQLIDCIMKTFIEPGDTIVIPTPSFSMYRLTAHINHGNCIEVPLGADYTYDVDQLLAVCKAQSPKLLFLCTPNNPTGGKIPEADMIRILEEVQCPVVVDEAYAEFSEETMIPFLDRYPHMMVLRTFSKAYGLAGMRIGYGIGSREFVEAVNITKPPYNLNVVSQKIGVAVLKQAEVYKKRTAETAGERQWLTDELSKIEGITVYPSDANFILIKAPQIDIGKLRKMGILVRDFSKGSNLEAFIRVSVGNRAENTAFLHAIQ